MKYKLTIYGRLPGLNEYTKANRGNKYLGNKMKQDCEKDIWFCILKDLLGIKIKKPVFLSYTWFEKDKKRDHDNVSFAQKFVQDSLVKSGVL